MNGNKVVFDTNALINFFNGQPSLQHHVKSTVTLSIISVLEFRSYPKITEEDETLLLNFLKKVQLINLNLNDECLIQEIITVRKNYKLKLPDAIIAATALTTNSTLITNDDGFKKVPSLKISTY